MTREILALTDALGNLVRFVLVPGQRFDTIGVSPLIKGVEFEGLIADKAFDSNEIIEKELNERGAKIVISQHPHRGPADHYRRRNLQVAAPDRTFLPETQGIQTYRYAKRQNRCQLLSHHLSCRRRHQFKMNLNKP